MERMRALFASTGLKSLTEPNASIRHVTEHTRALLAEIAGTFMFFVIGAGAIVTTVAAGSPPTGLLAIAFAHGLALSIAVSAFGPISGGHFNPAVTFGLAIARKHPWSRVLTYWAAQLIGAAMNPARHFGPAVVSGFLDNWYVYWLGPLIGAALAGLSYRYVFSPEAASFVVRPSRAAPQPTVPPSKDRTERI